MNHKENEWSEWEQYRKLKQAERERHADAILAIHSKVAAGEDSKNLLEDIAAAKSSYWDDYGFSSVIDNVATFNEEAAVIQKKITDEMVKTFDHNSFVPPKTDDIDNIASESYWKSLKPKYEAIVGTHKTKSDVWLQELFDDNNNMRDYMSGETSPIASHANPEYWKIPSAQGDPGYFDSNEYIKHLAAINQASTVEAIELKKASKSPMGKNFPPDYTETTEPKAKRPRYPSYKKNDRVTTPNGLGSVWSVEKDGTVCVELDSNPSILHEFEKKEIKKSK